MYTQRPRRAVQNGEGEELFPTVEVEAAPLCHHTVDWMTGPPTPAAAQRSAGNSVLAQDVGITDVPAGKRRSAFAESSDAPVTLILAAYFRISCPSKSAFV